VTAPDDGQAFRAKRPSLPQVAQWTSPDTIGADELFWRGVLDPRDRALDQALVGQPRLAFRRGRVNRD
jgi:hypothetical protein